MTRMLAAMAALAAGPALAHEGLHLHPHGIDAGWLVLGWNRTEEKAPE